MSKKRSSPSYSYVAPGIQQRRRKLYAVCEIPPALRPKFGRARFVQSLGTDSLDAAKRRAAVLIANWKSEIAAAKGEPDDAAFYRRALARAKDDRTRKRIKAAIELEAENIGSPTLTEDPRDHAEQEAAAHEAAEDFYARATGTVVGFTDYLDEWLARSQATDKTKAMQRSDVKRFAAEFSTVQDVTHEKVQRWIDGLGVAPKTVARILSALRGYWKYLQRPDVQIVPRDFQPFTNLDLPKRRNGPKEQRKAFAPREVVSLLIAADAAGDRELSNLIRLAMWTGCRIEELCSLKVAHVHKDAGVPYIEIEDAKTPAGWRQVPIHRALQQRIAQLVEESKDGYVLSGLTANKYGDRSNAVGKRFGRLKTARKFGPEYVFHSIRKTVATLLENAGVPEGVAADILGHDKPTMTYGLYSGGASLEVKAEALGKLRYADVAGAPGSPPPYIPENANRSK